MNRNASKQVAMSLLACILAISSAAEIATQTSIEEIIVRHVDQEEGRAIALIEKSVNINSGTMNFEGVQAVADLLVPEFEALGFSTAWVDGKPFARAGHLVANRDGGGGPKVLLIGHLDTVFPTHSPFQQFEVIAGYLAKGPGTTDMKGGNVIIIQALRALRAADVLDRLALRVVLTGDEESAGEPKSLRCAAIVDAGRWADYAIGFEDGDGDPKTAVIARRGATNWHLTVSGTRAHSSKLFLPESGGGAIYETARILNEFRETLSAEENLTFNPGLIIGGSSVEYDEAASSGSAFGKVNVISNSAMVVGDLRAVSLRQLEFAREHMRAIVADHLPMTEATIDFSDGYPPMAPSQGNYALLELLDQVSRDLGLGEVVAVDPRNAGAADISFAANDVEMAIDGLGLMGTGGHTLDEVADLRTFGPQTKRVAVLLHRLSRLN